MSETNSSSDVDLFGAPVTQIRERWGRKSFAKTQENQQLVALLIAAGWTQKRIAKYLGCDEKTLRKHFSRELADGADMIEAEALQVTFQQMRQGKGAAINRILQVVDLGRVTTKPPASPSREEEKIGKKEQLERDAHVPTEGWSETLQ